MICSLGAPPKWVSGAEVLVSFYVYLQNQRVSTDFLQDWLWWLYPSLKLTAARQMVLASSSKRFGQGTMIHSKLGSVDKNPGIFEAWSRRSTTKMVVLASWSYQVVTFVSGFLSGVKPLAVTFWPKGSWRGRATIPFRSFGRARVER